MAEYWLKLYVEILDDPKMAILPDRLWRRVVELFLVAKKLNKEGHLPDTRQIAWILRMPVDELDHDMTQISSTGIVIQEVGGWFIPKFQKRQSPVTGSERQQQHRERVQKQQYYDDVTEMSRCVTQRTENRLTESETETETEAESAPPSFPSSPPPPPDPFEEMLSAVQDIAHIMPAGNGAVKAIQELVTANITREDLQGGVDWLRENGKVINYASQLVGPAKTAQAKRLQKPHARKKVVERRIGAFKDILVYDDGSEEYVEKEVLA